MKRWCGWGELLINILSPAFQERGERHALLGGVSIAYQEVARDTRAAGELRRQVEKLVPGVNWC